MHGTRKVRHVYSLPKNNKYGPLGPNKPERRIFINMTIDEYETIRLIDLENLTQEECAKQMNVARTTVQGIYSKARQKIAQSLVHGDIILIEGGNYQFQKGYGKGPGYGRRRFL
ncbi:MAG: DUF134 domain-containing protein [Bacilli bacterium]|jgi:predicted DNA-binding protein (UPF0251 family)